MKITDLKAIMGTVDITTMKARLSVIEAIMEISVLDPKDFCTERIRILGSLSEL
jgi:hypothetical protein